VTAIDMRFDSWGLGYTLDRGEFTVHYPRKDKTTGTVTLGAGGTFAFDHRPEIQRNPQGERTKLWLEMLSANSRLPSSESQK
jgi:hypothetical protein